MAQPAAAAPWDRRLVSTPAAQRGSPATARTASPQCRGSSASAAGHSAAGWANVSHRRQSYKGLFKVHKAFILTHIQVLQEATMLSRLERIGHRLDEIQTRLRASNQSKEIASAHRSRLKLGPVHHFATVIMADRMQSQNVLVQAGLIHKWVGTLRMLRGTRDQLLALKLTTDGFLRMVANNGTPKELAQQLQCRLHVFAQLLDRIDCVLANDHPLEKFPGPVRLLQEAHTGSTAAEDAKATVAARFSKRKPLTREAAVAPAAVFAPAAAPAPAPTAAPAPAPAAPLKPVVSLPTAAALTPVPSSTSSMGGAPLVTEVPGTRGPPSDPLSFASQPSVLLPSGTSSVPAPRHRSVGPTSAVRRARADPPPPDSAVARRSRKRGRPPLPQHPATAAVVATEKRASLAASSAGAGAGAGAARIATPDTLKTPPASSLKTPPASAAAPAASDAEPSPPPSATDEVFVSPATSHGSDNPRHVKRRRLQESQPSIPGSSLPSSVASGLSAGSQSQATPPRPDGGDHADLTQPSLGRSDVSASDVAPSSSAAVDVATPTPGQPFRYSGDSSTSAGTPNASAGSSSSSSAARTTASPAVTFSVAAAPEVGLPLAQSAVAVPTPPVRAPAMATQSAVEPAASQLTSARPLATSPAPVAHGDSTAAVDALPATQRAAVGGAVGVPRSPTPLHESREGGDAGSRPASRGSGGGTGATPPRPRTTGKRATKSSLQALARASLLTQGDDPLPPTQGDGGSIATDTDDEESRQRGRDPPTARGPTSAGRRNPSRAARARSAAPMTRLGDTPAPAAIGASADDGDEDAGAASDSSVEFVGESQPSAGSLRRMAETGKWSRRNSPRNRRRRPHGSAARAKRSTPGDVSPTARAQAALDGVELASSDSDAAPQRRRGRTKPATPSRIGTRRSPRRATVASQVATQRASQGSSGRPDGSPRKEPASAAAAARGSETDPGSSPTPQTRGQAAGKTRRHRGSGRRKTTATVGVLQSRVTRGRRTRRRFNGRAGRRGAGSASDSDSSSTDEPPIKECVEPPDLGPTDDAAQASDEAFVPEDD